MVKTKMNIPAVLIHELNGTEYKVNGILLSVNESNDTCTMLFDDNYVENGIPMNKVLINEGFIDKIKEYGKLIASYITLKVKGFVALIDEKTNMVMTWSLDNVANLAIQASKGMLPKGVFFAASESLKQIAGVGSSTIDEAFAASMENDKKSIVNYWSKVMHRAGTTPNESIEESIKYVNEKYYKTAPLYKKLNESAPYSYEDVKDDNGFGYYGISKTSKQIKALLKTNIRNQISGPLGGHADVVPMLIWGAPGIGKTAIIKSTIKELANAKFNSINLNLEVVMLAGYTIENWTLPGDYTRNIQGVKLERFADKPKLWLPVYLDCSDVEEKKKRDHFCNTCKFLATNEDGDIISENGHPFEGGIVFFDEYSRVMPNVQNILMGLANDHKFGDNYNVASKWGFVFASNRAFDEGEADSEDPRYYPTTALSDRFLHFTYVPNKQEWIQWARTVDPLTHESNVPQFIVDFIEASPDYVWYSTITNGGYDDMLANPEADKRAHQNGMDAVLGVLDLPAIKGTKRVVTPRKWANTISNNYKLELKNLLSGNNEGLSGEEYYQKLLDMSLIEKTDEETGESYKEYYGDILPDILIDALNDIDEEYWDQWVEEKGGREELDPANECKGIRGRYNMLMNWFVDNMRNGIVDETGTNAFTATSPVIKAWQSYQQYARHFNADTMQYIWEHGKMPSEFLKDDDKKPLTVEKFNETTYSKWKAVATVCAEVISSLFKEYPGDIEADASEDLKALANAPVLSDKEVLEKALELNNQYTFNINSNKVSLLFDKASLLNINALRNEVNSLLYSKFALNFTHFAMWVAKIAIQSEIGNIAATYEEKILTDLGNKINTELWNDIRNQRGIITASAKLKKDKTPESKIAVTVELSKNLLMPALIILHRAKRYSYDSLKNKK